MQRRPRIERVADGLRVGDVQRPMFEYQNREGDAHQTLALLAAEHGLEIRACGSCVDFRFSGMSQQMSGGWVGYCSLAGFRGGDRTTVSIAYGCGEHALADGWPTDLERAQAARMARPMRPPRDNAFVGAMLGLAIGDALGFPAEFRKRAQIVAAFPPAGLDDFVALHDARWPGPASGGTRHPRGTYSDDTQMTVALAEALLSAGVNAPLDALMSAAAERFVAWSRSPHNNRGPGRACMLGCAELAGGAPWRTAGVADGRGCGSAMRVAPVGLLYWRDHDRLLEVARAQSLLTHRHEAAIESAAAAALLVALAMSKREPAEMHRALEKACAPGSADLARRLAEVPAMLDAPPQIALSAAGLGEGWLAEEAVASALYCFWRSPDDFTTTVLTAANTDGDSDSIASIAGGISGAFNGAAAIPAHWRDDVEDASALTELARRLSAAVAS